MKINTYKEDGDGGYSRLELEIRKEEIKRVYPASIGQGSQSITIDLYDGSTFLTNHVEFREKLSIDDMYERFSGV